MNLTIFEAIPKIMEDLGSIAKTEKGQALNYNFRSVDQLYKELHPILIKYGCFIVPNVTERKSDMFFVKDKAKFRKEVNISYRIYDSQGNFVEGSMEGEALDYSDKATAKAASMAFKYFCFQIFCVPTEEKLDNEYANEEVSGVIEGLEKAITDCKTSDELNEVSKLIKSKKLSPSDKTRLREVYEEHKLKINNG